jgi:plastocyanin
MDRRTYLRTAVVGGALALAGCGGGGNGNGNGDSNGNGDGDTTTEGPVETTEEPMETTEAPTETTEAPVETTEAPTTTESTETATEPTTSEPTTSEPTATPEPTTTPETADQVVAVGDGGLNFSPEEFTVSVGDTVRWVWESSNHNVVPDEVPSGTDWEGSPGAPGELRDEGFAFEHTFTTSGEYSYYCNPHRSAGMVGSFTVEE